MFLKLTYNSRCVSVDVSRKTGAAFALRTVNHSSCRPSCTRMHVYICIFS